MAKDDYNVLVFKVLTYLYGCLQRKMEKIKSAFLQGTSYAMMALVKQVFSV